MSANQIGERLVVSSFGESHGAALGVVIDGLPAGVSFSEEILEDFLARRRPGQSDIVTARRELDRAEILSGIYRGKTLGVPIALLVKNGDAHPWEYRALENHPRKGHCEDVWKKKYGNYDPPGRGALFWPGDIVPGHCWGLCQNVFGGGGSRNGRTVLYLPSL